MAKTKEPKVVEAAPAPVPTAAPKGFRYVDLMEHGVVTERVMIDGETLVFQFVHNGKAYRHISEHADGTWQYEV